MEVELQVLSPLVPARHVRFLRFCKQHAEGVWAVADISMDLFHDTSEGFAFPNCRRLPSGCILQDMPNACSKVLHCKFYPLLRGFMLKLLTSQVERLKLKRSSLLVLSLIDFIRTTLSIYVLVD